MNLILLSQPNCTPCTMVSKYLEERHISYEKINVWDYPDIAVQFSVMSVPTTILLDDDGKVAAKSVGFKSNELNLIIDMLKL